VTISRRTGRTKVSIPASQLRMGDRISTGRGRDLRVVGLPTKTVSVQSIPYGLGQKPTGKVKKLKPSTRVQVFGEAKRRLLK